MEKLLREKIFDRIPDFSPPRKPAAGDAGGALGAALLGAHGYFRYLGRRRVPSRTARRVAIQHLFHQGDPRVP